MKKYIYHIFTALSALLLLASCHQEEEIVVKKPTLKVVSADVIFGVEGGQGTIVVQSDAAVTVTSERPWAQTSVSGNTITVTVSEQNPNHMSRYSRLTITDGSAETYVTVHQYGEIFDGLDLADLDVEQGGTTLRYAYKANMPVQMASDQPWVHFAQDEENEGIMIVTVDENSITEVTVDVSRETPMIGGLAGDELAAQVLAAQGAEIDAALRVIAEEVAAGPVQGDVHVVVEHRDVIELGGAVVRALLHPVQVADGWIPVIFDQNVIA